jgi:hypothetical protein
VESLGEVSEVARDRLLTIGSIQRQPAALSVECVIQAADPRDPLIMVLSMEHLVALMRGLQHEQIEAAA